MLGTEKYSEQWAENRHEQIKRRSIPHSVDKWWIFSMSTGNCVNCGFELSEEAAWQKIHDCNLMPAEVLPLKTVNVAAAQRSAKGHIFQNTKDLSLALEHIKRKM